MLAKSTNDHHKRAAVAIALLASVCLSGTMSNAQEASAPLKLQLSPYMAVDVLASSEVLPEIGSVVQRDQIILSMQIKPAAAVVTNAASPPRPGTFPASLPTGTTLFRVELDNGAGYCAFWAQDQGIRNTQCFRDLNNDGGFDGAYRTERPIVGTSLYLGRLALLTAIPKLDYRPSDAATLQSDTWSYRFAGINRGKAEFKPQFGSVRNRLEPTKCSLSEGVVCRLGNHDFVFSLSNGDVKIVSITRAGDGFRLIANP